MSALVGDAVIAGRQTIPDMPQVYPPPVLSGGTSITSSGNLLPPNTYTLVLTAVNAWGETAGSNVETIEVALPQNNIQFSFITPGPGGAHLRAYLTSQNLAMAAIYDFPNVIASTLDFSQGTLIGNGNPPQIGRAFLPDTDGALVGAFAIFQWLNDGLKMISRETGGLLDYSGVLSAINQPLYTIPGEWNEITSIWYDGYWLTGGDRGQFFRRNTISSQILSAATISIINNQMVLEVYPQPARTAQKTTLSAAMGATDTTASLTSSAGFVLPFGFMQVDSEIMAYGAIAGNSMTGLLRGVGGQPAVTHALGAPVQELNIFWSGKRQLSPNYQPGSSLSQLPVPTGWEVLLAQYIGGRAKVIEHDLPTWDAFTKSMQASIKSWAGTKKPIASRRQVGGLSGPAVLYPDIAGGIILR